MNPKKTAISIASIVSAALLMGVAVAPAHAQTISPTPIATYVQTEPTTTVAATVSTNAASRLAKVISDGDAAITARIASLNTLNSRVQGIKNVSASEKTNISNEVQTEIANLTSLKVKIDADTSLATARTDAQSIYGSYRIYALVIPQGYISSSADRIDTVVGLMNALSAKLQTRIAADQSAGKDMTALQSALADLNAKTADAQSQASTAQTGVASLVPDQGNKTILASNTAALKASRADIKTASADLQAARQDATTIVKGLKALNVKVTASTTVSQ